MTIACGFLCDLCVLCGKNLFLDLLSMGWVDEDREWNFEKVK
jgi:hypothetical protein